MNKIFLVVLPMIILSGCVQNLPPAMLLPKTVDTVAVPLTTKAFVLEPVTLNKKEVEEHLNEENFKIALEETIKRSNVFGSDTEKPYIVKAYVLKATFPSAGFTMSSTLDVRYTVLNGIGAEIMKEDVKYEGTAGGSEEFLGSARALLAFQRTQQGHFALFLDKLKQTLKAEAAK